MKNLVVLVVAVKEEGRKAAPIGAELPPRVLEVDVEVEVDLVEVDLVEVNLVEVDLVEV